MKAFKYLLICLIISPFAFGQENNDVEMADALVSNGKIYIVLMTVLIVLVGLLLFLFRMEKKVSRLEKQLNDHKS